MQLGASISSHGAHGWEQVTDGSDLNRLITAIERELDVMVEVMDAHTAPTVPEGGRLLPLSDRADVAGGWLRVSPLSPGGLEAGSEAMIRLLARLLREEWERRCSSGDQAIRVRRVLREQDLRIVYQPIQNLDSGAIVGYEALSRFPSPPHQTPDRWFGDAAAEGLGVPLEVLAIKRALTALAQLPPEVYLSVNVSPSVAVSKEFLALLEGMALDRLVLEITEHAEVEDYKALNAVIVRLRRRGVRLAVDDTGSGFASMRHVLRLAPDIVKLDTTLTHDIDNDSLLRALGFSLKSFAAAIDAQVIAEGIETERELHALRFLGVRYGQGFYLRRPGPLTDADLGVTTPTNVG